MSIRYHKSIYPRADDRSDYDITSYDTEYGGVVSNFTSSIYDDNPQLYPNPEFLSRSNQGKLFPINEVLIKYTYLLIKSPFHTFILVQRLRLRGRVQAIDK